MIPDFLSAKDVELLYSSMPNCNYKMILTILLSKQEERSDKVVDSFTQMGRYFCKVNNKILSTHTEEIGIISFQKKNFNDLPVLSKIAVHNVLENYVKEDLKNKIIDICKQHNGSLEVNNLLQAIIKTIPSIKDYQIAVVLNEMKTDKIVNFHNAKFGDLYLPTGIITLLHEEII